MATIDIRKADKEEIIEIVFAETSSIHGLSRAYALTKVGPNRMTIAGTYESVSINTKQHALDLIKALEKAIELEWVK